MHSRARSQHNKPDWRRRPDGPLFARRTPAARYASSSTLGGMRTFAIFVIGCVVAATIFLIAFCRPKPDGGIYWTFITYAPVVAGGDGSSYKTAYRLKKGQAGSLATVEIVTIRDRYWVNPQRSYEDFYHKCYDTLMFTNATLNGRTYDVITFTLPEGTNTVYFDVTGYRQKGQRQR